MTRSADGRDRCEDCRHFASTGASDDGKERGWCELTRGTYQGRRLAVVRKVDSREQATDAALYVLGDFGCVQWGEAL